jgi:CYTH domain-containing protein/predicted ATPase
VAKKIYEIVLTGGPSGGKTTSMAVLKERFSDLGFRVLTVPEAATLLIGGGLDDIGTLAADHDWYMRFEATLLGTHRDLRERFRQIAQSVPEEKVIILFDRGEMDIGAYLDGDYFSALLAEQRLTLHDVRDSYDAVVHLRTAALGAEQFYTTANNAARKETPEQARVLDEKTLQSWVGHPHLRVIDNSTDFEEKIRRVVRAISRAVGVPVPLEVERKFLLAGPPDFGLPEFAGAQTVEIEQIYLRAEAGHEVRIRRRTQHGQSSYYLTEKRDAAGGARMEKESMISAREYLDLQRTRRDPARAVIRKQRTSFVYENQYFELDHLTGPGDLWLLEVELTEMSDRVTLPPSLRNSRDVTGDRGYYMGTISANGVPAPPADLGLS